MQCAPAVCSVPMHVVCYSVDCALHFECPCSVGIPCCSDNTLLSGTFRPSASPSESPAPSYIHLLHFERERENEKKDSQRFASKLWVPPPQCPKAKVLFLNMSSFILQVLVSVRSSCGISPSDHSTFVVQNLISANCTNQPQLCFLYKLCK